LREAPARQPAGAERYGPGDVRRLVGPARDLERAATDVEDRETPGRPTEPAAYGEEREARLVFAGQHVDADAGLVVHVVEHVLAVAGVAHGGGGEADALLAALVLGHDDGGGDEVGERVAALLGDVAHGVEVLGQTEGFLVRVRRERCGAV